MCCIIFENILKKNRCIENNFKIIIFEDFMCPKHELNVKMNSSESEIIRIKTNLL